VLIGTCGIIQGLGNPNVLHMRPKFSPRRLNVTLEGHGVTSKDDFRV
jgi:hypothetical protein